MAKTEITSALKNAVSRGESIEKAMKSMLNAGYNQQEVEQAAAGVRTSGSMGLTGKMPQPAAPKQLLKQETPAKEAPKEKKKFPWKAVILSAILLILLGVLTFIIIRM